MRSPILGLLAFIIFGCSTTIKVNPHKRSASSAKAPVEFKPESSFKIAFDTTEKTFQDHAGFMLYDPDKKETIYAFNEDRYFTPGSNTKIFTFYTALRILGDSVPALKFVERKDSLIFWGTGDPSFLYKFTFNNFRVYDFLKNSKKNLYFSNSNFHASYFGAGWAWDDYNYAFSSERSPFPVYGNIFGVERAGGIVTVTPSFFEPFFSIGERKEKEELRREVASNKFQIHPGVKQPRSRTWDVPMKVDQKLITDLLSDTLKRKVIPVNIKQPPLAQPVYSILADSLYSVLIQDSDNFIAEQLLLMCANTVRDSLKTETAIKYSIANFLTDLPDKPIWADGSGLSRYNLFTPRTIVKMWEKIAALVPRERLLPLLATGGVNGTVKNWYKNDRPYIFGKTGTLSNNHTLSGFLVAKSGKVLIFSFMNNNYVATTNDIRKNMENILRTIYENY
jgi:D-alanyl-D-alanine carboxypeptidase/D-alanyl-D-alanine-endopeptidase (penicillin-binding protein 4)